MGDEQWFLSQLENFTCSSVVRANFNGIYWLNNPSSLINFVEVCPNIRRLDVLETTVGLREFLSLLPRLKKLTSVSLTIHHDQELDILREENPFRLDNLQQLTHVELALHDAVREWDLRFLP